MFYLGFARGRKKLDSRCTDRERIPDDAREDVRAQLETLGGATRRGPSQLRAAQRQLPLTSVVDLSAPLDAVPGERDRLTLGVGRVEAEAPRVALSVP